LAPIRFSPNQAPVDTPPADFRATGQAPLVTGWLCRGTLPFHSRHISRQLIRFVVVCTPTLRFLECCRALARIGASGHAFVLRGVWSAGPSSPRALFQSLCAVFLFSAQPLIVAPSVFPPVCGVFPQPDVRTHTRGSTPTPRQPLPQVFTAPWC